MDLLSSNKDVAKWDSSPNPEMTNVMIDLKNSILVSVSFFHYSNDLEIIEFNRHPLRKYSLAYLLLNISSSFTS